jgi:hypothetical protein
VSMELLPQRAVIQVRIPNRNPRLESWQDNKNQKTGSTPDEKENHMKNHKQLNATWRRLSLLTIAAWLGGLALPARAGLFLNETFQGEMLPIGGWENNVVVSQRDYVDGVGVDGSRAMQMTGAFQSWDAWFAIMYLNPIISGNAGATLANTVMSFDVKTDVPAPYLGVGLQSWPGNGYVGSMSSSVGYVPLPAGVPGQFQTVIVCLANPLWVVPPWDPSITTPFDPAGGTIQVYFQAEPWQFAGPDTSATVTIDNLRFWTVKLVPYKSSIQMQVVAQSDDPVSGIRQQVLEGKGISSHMGAVTVWTYIEIGVGGVDPSGSSYVSHISGVEIETAANGDTVESAIEAVYSIPLPWPDPFVGVITGTRTVTGGTGRFLGATGSMTLDGVDANDGVTLKIEGSISTVGSSKQVGLGK